MRSTPRFCPQCGGPLEWRERFGRLRPVCTLCGQTVFLDPKVAVVALVTSGDTVLLVRRHNDPGRGLWALPAGFLDPDEDPEAAVCREVEEETGLRVTPAGLIGLFHRPDPDGLADLVIAYSATASGGMLCAGDDADEAGWFSAQALATLPLALATTERLLFWWREQRANDAR